MAEEKKPVQEPEQEANTEPAEESAKAAEKEKKKKKSEKIPKEDYDRLQAEFDCACCDDAGAPQAAAPARACRVR